MKNLPAQQSHSQAWVVQTWISFAISTSAMAIGILYLPVDGWIKGYLGMGMAFTLGSTMSLTKTVRDEHEAKRLLAKVDEARVEKLLAEHHPLR
ncbi:YiaA/YiaB family inner membrane protein [Leptolyngbya ohadii]|uniref:YiaA/YiaB family inner membrane protein n=1 Tax=Leptolyngbya ohadii TaxID=1962290 RepID=UPI000B59FDCC|nr:YiaA/YiaB family inner membrane protein [Leptolyngbya ohadii]